MLPSAVLPGKITRHEKQHEAGVIRRVPADEGDQASPKRVPGTAASYYMTPRQANVANNDWLALREQRAEVDSVVRMAGLAHDYARQMYEERNNLIAIAVANGEARAVATACGLSRAQVYEIASRTRQ